ncbi:MAG: NAD(P)H-binding protein [Hyphomicrobiales bacterium]
MNVLVLGAYGFIGSEITRALLKQSHKVCGFGRSAMLGKRLIPHIEWVQGDLRTMSVSDWQEILTDIDVVVNAAGALQNSSRDTLDQVHVTAIKQLLRAATSNSLRIVQISAAGVSPDSPNDFLRTKAEGDTLIMASGHKWVILKPALVFGAQAYGGTAILRAQASLPLVQFLVFPDSRIQTVSVSDLANATVAAVDGRVASGTIADLAEDQSRPLKAVVKLLRAWQGFPEPKLTINLSNILIAPIAKIADFLGYLGWRSPLRSNALTVLKNGILANAST